MQPFSPLFPACYNILVAGNIRPHIFSTHFTSTMTGLTAVSDARLFPSDQEGTLSSSLLEFHRVFLRTMREFKTYQSYILICLLSNPDYWSKYRTIAGLVPHIKPS